MNDILNPYKNPFSKAVNTDRYMNHHRLVDEIKEDNKINYLLSQGWEYLDFKIDFNYLNKLDPFKLFKNTLNLIENCSRVVLHPSNHFLTSITSLFGREVQTYWYTYILSLNPNPISSAYINYCSLYDYSNSSSQTISDILISKVNSLLGKPTAIYQQCPYFTFKILDILDKLDELFPSEDFTYDSTYEYIWWTGANYKITLDWGANTVEVQYRFSENKVIFENTFWEQDSTGIDEWELNVDKFVERIKEIINNENNNP